MDPLRQEELDLRSLGGLKHLWDPGGPPRVFCCCQGPRQGQGRARATNEERGVAAGGVRVPSISSPVDGCPLENIGKLPWYFSNMARKLRKGGSPSVPSIFGDGHPLKSGKAEIPGSLPRCPSGSLVFFKLAWDANINDHACRGLKRPTLVGGMFSSAELLLLQFQQYDRTAAEYRQQCVCLLSLCRDLVSATCSVGCSGQFES